MISPLGSYFHNSIYPQLSLVTHQSYIHLEFEASEFFDTDPDSLPLEVQQIARWMNVLTAALLIRVRNDIGISTTCREE